MSLARTLTILGALVSLAACSTRNEKKSTMDTTPESPANPPAKVVKSDAEWKRQLSDEQYRILRQADTERPNGEAYKQFKQQGKGTYHCAACKTLLFSSDQKFDSGCGWPSFFDPAKADHVMTRSDTSSGSHRVEVICAICDGHLGHVFTGEGFNTPTDKRFCINGGGLTFVPAQQEPK